MANEYIDSNGLETLWGQIRAADALNVSKAGDTMTGTLNAPQIIITDSNGWPNLLFHTTSSDTYNGALQFNGSSANHFTLVQKNLNNPDYYESFGLPDTDSGLTASKWYSILTTKSPVTIAQGGTGQTARAEAMEALFGLGSSPIASTTNDTVAKWKELKTGLAWYGTSGQLNGQPTQYGFLLNMTSPGASISDVHQIWAAQNHGSLFHRGGNSSGWGSNTWKTILDSSNYTNFVTPANIGAAASSHTHTLSQITDGTTLENLGKGQEGGTTSNKTLASQTWVNIANSGTLTAGTYILFASVTFNTTNSSGRREIVISTASASGTAVNRYAQVRHAPCADGYTNLSVATWVKPTANTTYYINAYQTSGASLTAIGGIYALQIK